MKNPKIVASFAVGCALVLLALVFSDFGKRAAPAMMDDGVRIAKAPERTHIKVADENNNGIPDWQELIVPSGDVALILENSGGDYEKPSTLTGQASVEFIKQLIDMKSGNSFATSEEEFVEQFAGNVLRGTEDVKVTMRDITTTPATDPESVRTYVNAVATIFISEGFIESAGDEIVILNEAVETNSAQKLSELSRISSQLTRSIERTKAIPAPQNMTTEHINILNTATSLRNDILGMEQLFADPMYAFVRIRRYEQDTVNITEAFFALRDQAIARGANFSPQDPINFQ